MLYIKKSFAYFSSKERSNDDLGVARDSLFQEIRPGAGFKTGDFVQRKVGGGYRRTVEPTTRYSLFFFHPIYCPRTTLMLPPSSNLDPESHSGPFSPLPTTVRAFIFIARGIQSFLLPWSNCTINSIELLNRLRASEGKIAQ